jgi:hypothetical protein
LLSSDRFPNPRVVVAELIEPDCAHNYTSWNITLLDQIYEDFSQAVGNHTVAMQLSTLPAWVFTDGYPLDKTKTDPWQPNLDYGRVGWQMRRDVWRGGAVHSSAGGLVHCRGLPRRMW